MSMARIFELGGAAWFADQASVGGTGQLYLGQGVKVLWEIQRTPCDQTHYAYVPQVRDTVSSAVTVYKKIALTFVTLDASGTHSKK